MINKTKQAYTVESDNIIHLSFDNFEQMETYGKNWSCYSRYRFGSQPFGGKYDICQHENFQIANAVYDDGLMYKGYAPRGTITLAVIIEKYGSITANRKMLNKGEILILDDDHEYEIAFSHHLHKGVVSLRKEFVDKHFPYLYDMINKVYYDTNSTLKNMILHLENDLECNNNNIQSQLIQSLESLSLEHQNEIPKKLSKKELLIFDIRDYLIEHSEENVSLKDLVSTFNISDKTIQTGFRKFFGYTPKKFIKLLKLNIAYQEIIKNDRAKTISEIAMQYGFGNFGLFARDYKRLYGLLPHESVGGGNNNIT
jgi:AraC family ethanolamine operon transcriptional activator